MRVAIRADASAEIGLGHLKRCLSLAAALQTCGADVHFVGHVDADVAARLISRAGFGWHPLPPADEAEDAQLTAARVDTLLPDVVIVDHYRLAAPWHQAVRRSTGASIVVIDDLANRPLDADLLIDHNADPDVRAKYRQVLRESTPLCGGPRYALIDGTYPAHARSQCHEEVHHIGIFMGGTHPGQHTAWAWRILRHELGWQGQITLATTSANIHWPSLTALAAQDERTSVLMDQPHLADFHAACDLEIGAGGGAQWERCCLGVPTVALVCADNQQGTVSHLDEMGVIVGLDARGQTPQQATDLARSLTDLMRSASQRRLLQQRSLTLVDGRGAQHVAEAILSLVAHQQQPGAR